MGAPGILIEARRARSVLDALAMIKTSRRRRWLFSATVVTTAGGLVACGSDRTLGCMGFYAGSEADGGTGAEGRAESSTGCFVGCIDAAVDADAAPGADARSDAAGATDADGAGD
jgi:hypothetical protein